MSINACIVRWDTLRSLAFGSMSTINWIDIGTPFEVQTRILTFTNTTDADVYISTIGINGQEQILSPAKSIKVYDLTTNAANPGGYLVIPEGTWFKTKALTVPTEGALYVEAIYASEF